MKRRAGSGTLAALLLCGCASAGRAGPGPYLGLRHPPLPAGVEDLAGYVVDIGPGGAFTHAVGHVRTPSGQALWLERFLRHDEQGVAYFEVVAVQPLPPLGEGEAVVMASCRVGDAMQGGDNETIAIVRWEEAEVLDDVRAAWRVDLAARRFHPIPAAGVQCLNEGFGA